MLVLLSLLISYSSFSSGSGNFNLYSARTLPSANLAFNAHLSAAQQNYDSLKHFIGYSNIGFTYGVFDYLELYLGTTLYGKLSSQGKTFDPDKEEHVIGDKDLYTGLKFYFPLIGSANNTEGQTVNWLLGGHIGDNFSTFHSDKDDSLAIYSHFEPTLKHHSDIALDLLSDIEIYPLLIHLSGGYKFRGDYFDFHIPDTLIPERQDLLCWGAGFEIAAGPYTRFVFETKGINPQHGKADTLIGTFGIRFTSPEKFTFDLGVDYAFSDSVDFVPDWKINDLGRWRFRVGFSTQSALIPLKKKEKKVEKGAIALTVNDIKTDEPLDASITFRDTTLPVYRTGEDGKVNIEILPGVYHITLSKEGYVPREASITVKPSSVININTVLREKERLIGGFTGTVSSFRDLKPLATTIEFLGTKIKPITSDPEKGIFKGELPSGTYNVRVSSEGYLPQTFAIIIKEGETTIKNIKMIEKLEEKKKLVLRGIHFATGKTTIPPDGYPILDKVVSVLKANKNVKVEISGHTDSVGSASYNLRLSDGRAQSVRQYLIQQGIDSSRLVARGYGESKPIAPNTTREGRAENRRIEFTVILQ
ncbi:MAG: OmpA family protein [candidate division WOR-3 bacterium]|nr:OmpA family protein [candidate division WOR-3 bacterium]